MRRLLTLVALSGLVAFQALPVFAADGDGDIVEDEVDVCPEVADPFQGDLDGDGIGDICETDAGGVTTFDGTPEGELIIGTSGADTLSGAGGNDAIYGLEGDDALDGGEGRDFLSGGPGADTLTGGAGCDVFAFAPVGEQDVITDFDPETDRLLFPPQDDDPSDDPAPVATFGGDDHLVVTFGADGSTTATLDLPGLPAGVEITFSNQPCAEPEEPFVCAPLFDAESNDMEIFDVELSVDGVALFGTSADETLLGTQCGDIIVGDVEIYLPDSEGSEPPELDEPPCDTVCSDDVIRGLGGNDLLVGDKTVIQENETGGDDTIYGGDGDDAIIGDAALLGDLCVPACLFGPGQIDGPIGGNDTLYGEGGNDAMFGDALEAILGGYGGDDYMDGGDGDDIIIGDAGFFIGDLGVGGNDTLIGGDGDDWIIGDTLEEIEDGSSGGDDILNGGAGDDTLMGDAELVDGDAGQDTFVYDADSDFGDDTIADLGTREVVDIIQFSGTGLLLGDPADPDPDDLTELDARSIFEDDPSDSNNLLATVYAESAQSNKMGSIVIVNAGSTGGGGGGITSWTTLEGSWPVDVIIV